MNSKVWKCLFCWIYFSTCCMQHALFTIVNWFHKGSLVEIWSSVRLQHSFETCLIFMGTTHLIVVLNICTLFMSCFVMTRAWPMHQHPDIYWPVWRYCRFIISAKFCWSFWLRLQNWFGPLKTKNQCSICATCLPHKLYMSMESNFQAPAPPPKSYWFWLQPSKIAGVLAPQP